MENAQRIVTRLSSNTIYSHIQSFLRNKGIKSKNTEKAYEYDIRQFFQYMKGKDIENLNVQDLHFINSDVMDYQTYLYNDFRQSDGKKYSNITINRKMNAIVSLYRYLKRNGYNVDPDIMKVDNLVNDSKQIGFLTVEEVEHMLIMVQNEELKMFIILALHTSMRKNPLINLRWNQIEPNFDDPEYYIISTLDKTKKIFKEIHSSIYEDLLKIKKDDEKVFTTPLRTMDYRFKALCKKAGIDDRRKVSIHSLRKAGIDFVKQYTGDIHTAQHQANHSSPSITDKLYVQKPNNIAARLLVEKTDEKIFDELSHEECLELLKSFGNGIGYQLRQGAKKIIEKRG